MQVPMQSTMAAQPGVCKQVAQRAAQLPSLLEQPKQLGQSPVWSQAFGPVAVLTTVEGPTLLAVIDVTAVPVELVVTEAFVGEGAPPAPPVTTSSS